MSNSAKWMVVSPAREEEIDTATAAGSTPTDSGSTPTDSGDLDTLAVRIDHGQLQIDRLQDETRAGFTEMRTEMRTGFAEMREEMQQMHTEVRDLIVQVEKNSMLRVWNAHPDLTLRLKPLEKSEGGYPTNFPANKCEFLQLPEAELIQLLREYGLPVGDGRQARQRTLAEFLGF